MTKKQYRKKCQKLFCKAKRLGVKLKFSPDYFHHQRLNCLWHGGTVAEIIVSKELVIELSAYGDVRATLYDEQGEELAYSKDKSNTGAFTDNMYPYLTTDKQLKEALEKNLLKLDNNNWIEYDGYVLDKKTGKMEFVDLGMIVDNIVDDDILIAINEVLDSLEQVKEEILWVAKGDESV